MDKRRRSLRRWTFSASFLKMLHSRPTADSISIGTIAIILVFALLISFGLLILIVLLPGLTS
jgi:hypothetical protein